MGVWLSTLLAAVDRIVIDGTVNAVGWATARTGQAMRHIQDGHVQAYLLVAVVSMAIWLLLTVRRCS